MAWFNLKFHPKCLRTRLLTPIILLVVAGSTSISITQELTARRHIKILVNQRGVTVLEGLAKRLQERQ